NLSDIYYLSFLMLRSSYTDDILLALPERHNLHALFLAAQATLSEYGLIPT
ncbi:Hypothetical predicted protein, partial [Lynx pardinus]